MTEIDCFIEFDNTEPFMMSIDKEVDFQTFDSEIKKRRNNISNFEYSYHSYGHKVHIKNDEDLQKALSYAESCGEEYLFVINVIEAQPLQPVEILPQAIPEGNSGDENSNSNAREKETEKEKEKEGENKVDFVEFLKNQISQQLPGIAPFIQAIDLNNILPNLVNNEKEENNRKQGDDFAKIITDLFPVVLSQISNPNSSQNPFSNLAPHISKLSNMNPQPQPQPQPKPRPFPSLQFFSPLEDLLNCEIEERRNEESNNVHFAFCDQCEKRISGIRYKCLSCPDFDLCELCESQLLHDPSHIFAKIRNPSTPLHSLRFQSKPFPPPHRHPHPRHFSRPSHYPHPHSRPHLHPLHPVNAHSHPHPHPHPYSHLHPHSHFNSHPHIHPQPFSQSKCFPHPHPSSVPNSNPSKISISIVPNNTSNNNSPNNIPSCNRSKNINQRIPFMRPPQVHFNSVPASNFNTVHPHPLHYRPNPQSNIRSDLLHPRQPDRVNIPNRESSELKDLEEKIVSIQKSISDLKLSMNKEQNNNEHNNNSNARLHSFIPLNLQSFNHPPQNNTPKKNAKSVFFRSDDEDDLDYDEFEVYYEDDDDDYQLL